MENMMKFGPTEMKGSIWDDKGKTQIAQILISYGKTAVHSIQFVYVVDGKLLPSKIHGTPSGLNFDILKFNGTTEYLTSVSGQYMNYDGDRSLASITFGTNRGFRHGPYGRVSTAPHETGYFAYNFGSSCLFGGFHGSDYNSNLNAIGVYVKAPVSVAETEAKIGRVKSEED